MSKRKNTRIKVTNVRVTKNTVTMKVNGKPVWDRWKRTPRVPMVGHYKRKQPMCMVDRKIRDTREEESIAFHEGIERDLRFKHGWGPLQAHRFANKTEGKWDHKHGINIPKLNRDVERVFRKNRIPGQRRKR